MNQSSVVLLRGSYVYSKIQKVNIHQKIKNLNIFHYLIVCWIKGKKVDFGIYTDKLSKEYNEGKSFIVYDYVNENVIAWADFNAYPE